MCLPRKRFGTSANFSPDQGRDELAATGVWSQRWSSGFCLILNDTFHCTSSECFRFIM